MPKIVKYSEVLSEVVASGVSTKKLLHENSLNDKRMTLEVLKMDAYSEFVINNSETSVSWVQILEGEINIDQNSLTKEHLVFFPLHFSAKIKAKSNSKLVYVSIPNAKSFDESLEFNEQKSMQIINWFKEPVLNSEFDNRKRIYVMSEALANTSVAKGEIIIYPPNTSAPEHYHVGAEHFQFMMSGEGIAVLGGVEHKLEAFDLLYNFENENHYFYNSSNSEFVFVEFFVPGKYKTIWAPDAKVCTWLPTGKNYLGNAPSRDIKKHVAGEGEGI